MSDGFHVATDRLRDHATTVDDLAGTAADAYERIDRTAATNFGQIGDHL